MRTGAAVICFLLVFHSVCCQSEGEENWVDPHDNWSGLVQDFSHPEGFCQCPATPEQSPAALEDGLALIYFKKFVNQLFQRQRLQYDAKSALYKRSLLFSLMPSQLEELEKVKDARDLDIWLTKIMERAVIPPLFTGQSEYSYFRQGVLSFLLGILKFIVALTKISEVQFMLFAASAIGLACLVRKRYRIGLISIVFGGIFLCGYIYKYLECNRKLEVEAMVEVLTGNSAEVSWFGKLKGVFFSQDDAKIEMLKKSSKMNLSICMPDQVLFMYLNDLFIKQLEMLLERMSETMTRLSFGLSFPFNILSPILLVALVMYIIKLTFKYIVSPKAWASILHKNPTPINTQTAQHSIRNKEPVTDSISGENLKMLLNVMHVNTVQQQSKQTPRLPAVSGVQELVEPVENPPSPEKKENIDVSDSSSKSRNSSVREEEGFTLVDDHEDDNNDNM